MSKTTEFGKKNTRNFRGKEGFQELHLASIVRKTTRY
jgi:hypothetical protein